MENQFLDDLSVKTLRVLSLEQINNAASGHPGIALGAAPAIHALFKHHLKISPKRLNWIDRDRFVLSAGHGSSLLYSVLHLAQFNITKYDLKNFRQIDSITPGHPEFKMTDGVEAATGPLGQGIANAVGMALAESHLSAKFNKKDIKVIDHYTYCLCSDGDLQEGIANEALSFAGHNNLHKLILLYDSNDIQLDSELNYTFSEDIKTKIESIGFNYIKVENGELVDDIDVAITEARKSNKPTMIEIKTLIGKGSTLEDSTKVHGAPLSSNEVLDFRANLGGEEFSVSDEVSNYYEDIKIAGEFEFKAWESNMKYFSVHYEKEYMELMNLINNKYDVDFSKLPTYDKDYNKATRVSSGEVLFELSKQIPQLFGGAADLASSTKTIIDGGIYTKRHRENRNILYGVREHAMGAISNGLALHQGFIPFASTFFVFSDYLKPAIRLSALMGLQVIYLFTHDSIAVGEDGPTHEPIEQITMLRSIPNINVFRPADANEVKVAWQIALEDTNKPSAIILTRQNVDMVTTDSTVANAVKGCYIVKKEVKKLDGIIICSGSEVSLAIKSAEALKKKGYDIRVCSMLSMNVFDSQSEEYKSSVIPDIDNIMALEMSEGSHYYKYLSKKSTPYFINTFGKSGKGNEVIKDFKYDVENIVLSFEKMIKNNK
ncbi:MAG TPA: transketolase [Acholeplasmataceae bacterium]|nr:transketolase [Acholeplasmataceae bacterium]